MSDREVQLPDPESNRTGRADTRRSGLGPADRAGSVQNAARPLPRVPLRRTAAAHGGDGTETQPVRKTAIS